MNRRRLFTNNSKPPKYRSSALLNALSTDSNVTIFGDDSTLSIGNGTIFGDGNAVLKEVKKYTKKNAKK